MKWIDRDGKHLAAPYRIYRTTRGFDAWYYGRKNNYILARDLSLAKAKEICEKHKAKELASQ